MLSKLKELGTATKRLMMAILMPLENVLSQFSKNFSKRGNILDVSVARSNYLVDTEHLYNNFLTLNAADRIETCHPKLIGFERFLKSGWSCSMDSISMRHLSNEHLNVH